MGRKLFTWQFQLVGYTPLGRPPGRRRRREQDRSGCVTAATPGPARSGKCAAPEQQLPFHEFTIEFGSAPRVAHRERPVARHDSSTHGPDVGQRGGGRPQIAQICANGWRHGPWPVGAPNGGYRAPRSALATELSGSPAGWRVSPDRRSASRPRLTAIPQSRRVVGDSHSRSRTSREPRVGSQDQTKSQRPQTPSNLTRRIQTLKRL